MQYLQRIFFLSFFIPLSVFSQLTYTVTVPQSSLTCFIAGEMTGWIPVEMHRSANNSYNLFINDAHPGQAYKYLSGPGWEYTERRKDGSSRENRKYFIKDSVEVWSVSWNYYNNFPPHVLQGKVNRTWFRSKWVDNRYVDVWLPPHYNSRHKYDVLYMHDGQMLFDRANWNGQEWNVDSTLSLLMAMGAKQTIVIAIHNNGLKRHKEFFPVKVLDNLAEPFRTELEKRFKGDKNADDYLRFIVKELKPFIDSNYSTNSGQQHTHIAGSSMGGLISLYAFCEYPDVFSSAACLSTHWIGIFTDNNYIPNAINAYLKNNLPSTKGRKIYFDHGTVGLDSLYGNHQLKIDQTFKAKGYNHSNWKSIVYHGANHNEDAWQKRFAIPAKFILSGWQSTF
jgi:predicted alpha/beta superfamily hydrolase